MKILTIADHESVYLWDYFDKSKVEGVDLIISCGDLDPRYLSFLATLTSVPVLYVHGNHDEIYDEVPPEGCICIDDKVYVHNGVRILGLGGSMRYRPGKHQYSQQQMFYRYLKAKLRILLKGGVDILVAHAPAYQINDGEDLPHQGFKAFLKILDKYHPKFFLHGHVHLSYGRKHKRIDNYNGTQIINAYERHIFDY